MNSDTGEHMTNEKNELEYIPFPICNETRKPLELQYGVEEGMFGSSILLLCNAERMLTSGISRNELHHPHDIRSLLSFT